MQPFWAAKQQLHTPGSCLAPVELQVMYSKSRQYMGQNLALARLAHASVVWMEQPMTMSPAIIRKRTSMRPFMKETEKVLEKEERAIGTATTQKESQSRFEVSHVVYLLCM